MKTFLLFAENVCLQRICEKIIYGFVFENMGIKSRGISYEFNI